MAKPKVTATLEAGEASPTDTKPEVVLFGEPVKLPGAPYPDFVNPPLMILNNQHAAREMARKAKIKAVQDIVTAALNKVIG